MASVEPLHEFLVQSGNVVHGQIVQHCVHRADNHFTPFYSRRSKPIPDSLRRPSLQSDLKQLILGHRSIIPTDETFEAEPLAFHFNQVGLLRLRVFLAFTYFFIPTIKPIIVKTDPTLLDDIEMRRHRSEIKYSITLIIGTNLKLTDQREKIPREKGCHTEMLFVNLINLFQFVKPSAGALCGLLICSFLTVLLLRI